MLLSILSNMYLSTMSNSNFSHYTMSFIPLLIIPTSIILSKINSNIKKDNCMIMVLITIFLTSKSMAACVDNIYRNIKGKYDRGFYYAINELTTEDETIYIFDGYMQMYHTKRLSASKYIYTPIQFNIPQEDKIEILDELLDELQTNKPKLILISDKAYEKYTNLPYYNFKPYIELMEKNYVQGQKINDFNVYILVND